MKKAIVILIIACVVVAADLSEIIDDDSLCAKLERNLENAGDNRAVFERAITEVDKSIREGLIFVLANSPSVNLVAFDIDSLIEEVRLAYAARDKYPWGREISKEQFLHYVLPNQVSQEQHTFYRAYFMEQFGSLLDTVQTGSAAAIAINYWCGERVRFQQTQRQDQGVFFTL